MKLIILKTNLKDGIAVVEKATSESGNLPILKNILLKTNQGKIKLVGTNLEIGITKYVPGKVVEEGGITVPVQVLRHIISHIDSERVNLEVKNNVLFVKTDNYNAKIQGIGEDEFPIIPEVKNKSHYLKIDSPVLKNALYSVLPAVNFSEIRPEISGVLLDFQLTMIKCAATDTFRLAEKTINNSFESNIERGFKVIVPLKTVNEVVRIFDDSQPVSVFIDENQILLKNDDTEIISRLIDGRYPDYEAIIPKNIDSEINTSKENLINAVRLVSNLSTKNNDILLRLQEGGKAVEVYSSNHGLGENSYLIPVKFKGEQFPEVAFNWRYVLDGLKSIEAEKIYLGINGATKPTVIKSLEDNSYLYILMPINLKG